MKSLPINDNLTVLRPLHLSIKSVSLPLIWKGLSVSLCIVQRKKLLREDGDEERLKTLRKKNLELTTSNKDLEDRMRVLKAENDHLVRRCEGA